MTTRELRLCEAATQLLVAREAIKEARMALHSGAEEEDDPMWGFAQTALEIGDPVDNLRVAVYDAMFRNPRRRRVG